MVQKCENERRENMVGKNTIVEQERYIKKDNGCMELYNGGNEGGKQRDKQEGCILVGAAALWEEGGNWDSPGKGEPQGFKYCIIHY